MEERNEKRITVRVSPAMYEQVAEAARAMNMSVNGYIIRALESAADNAATAQRLATIEQKLRALEERN